MLDIITQAVGYGGILLNCLIYLQKDRKKLVFTKLLSDIAWAAHYFLLGAYAGFSIAAIGIVRETVSYNKQKKWASSVLWPIFFMIVGVGGAVLSERTWYSLLPAFASAVSVICFWQNRPSKSRLLALLISVCMATYDVFKHSTAGIVNEILTVASVFLGMLLHDRKKKGNHHPPLL